MKLRGSDLCWKQHGNRSRPVRVPLRFFPSLRFAEYQPVNGIRRFVFPGRLAKDFASQEILLPLACVALLPLPSSWSWCRSPRRNWIAATEHPYAWQTDQGHLWTPKWRTPTKSCWCQQPPTGKTETQPKSDMGCTKTPCCWLASKPGCSAQKLPRKPRSTRPKAWPLPEFRPNPANAGDGRKVESRTEPPQWFRGNRPATRFASCRRNW